MHEKAKIVHSQMNKFEYNYRHEGKNGCFCENKKRNGLWHI